MAMAAVSSAARTAFRSSSVRSAATRLGSQAKAARCPFRLPSRNPLAHRIFRCPAEMGACMGSMQPYHNATASALMTSMLTVSRCGYGWLPEGKLKVGSERERETQMPLIPKVGDCGCNTHTSVNDDV